MKHAIFILLAACGRPIGPTPYQCQDEIFQVNSEIQVDCKKVESNIALAKKLMLASGLVGDFSRFQGTELRVRKEPRTWEFMGSQVGGLTFLGTSELNSDMFDLVHELFHVQDEQDLDFLTIFHPGWDRNGRQALQEIYSKTATGTVSADPCASSMPAEMESALKAAGLYAQACD